MDEFLDSKFALDVMQPALLEKERLEREAYLTDIYNKVDVNGDGELSVRELHYLVKLMFPKLGPEGVQAYVNCIAQEMDKVCLRSMPYPRF